MVIPPLKTTLLKARSPDPRILAELERRKRLQKAAAIARLLHSLRAEGQELLLPRRYKALHGGRGGEKSWRVATALLYLAMTQECRILCAREFQESIKESVYTLLKRRIIDLQLTPYFHVGREGITSKINNSEFIFRGIKRNVTSIQSIEGVTHLWVEEAQSASLESWTVLIPTIRSPNSEIWVTFNPNKATDVVYRQFIENPRPNAYIRKLNWRDNPHFPAVLEEERLWMLQTDPDLYQHVWEGQLRRHSNAEILKGKWTVQEFQPENYWNLLLQGVDFGFATSPTVLIRVWEHDRCLWVQNESCHLNLELDLTLSQWEADVPSCTQFATVADSARPEAISYLRRSGFPLLYGAKKTTVVEGIAHLKSYRQIIVHPRCKQTIANCQNYSYKMDGAGLPTNEIIDKHNDCIDALRYAVLPRLRLQQVRRRHAQLEVPSW